ncbi:MAG: hypothetical protein IKX74_00440 [Erysipelotrichaceae bacterium]|nr:hypothetical protein [Erysipelotrichaceae bacterium]
MELHRIIGHFLMKHFAGKRQPVVDSGKKHIACIGDSITYGNGVRGKKELTWEFLLNEILGDEYQVINYGASGRTLQKEGDFPYVDDPICQYSRQCQAEMYIIMLGTNDAKHFNWNRKRYEEQYRQFAQSYLDLPGRPKVVLMIPPCCYPDPLSGIVAFFVDRQVIDLQLPEIIRQTGEEMGLPVIDLHELTAGHPEWFADGVHPNAEGNRAIAQAIASLLKP